MGERAFEEVFPELRLSPAVERMIQGVKVTRIAMYNETGRMEVYLESTHLIEKEIIYRLEEELRSFLFGRSRMVVKIVERYLLSEAYTADKLLKLYMPSLLLELSKENHVSYRLIKKGGYRIEDQVLFLSMAENELAKSREQGIRKFFENIMVTRFGMSIGVSFSYVPQEVRKADAIGAGVTAMAAGSEYVADGGAPEAYAGGGFSAGIQDTIGSSVAEEEAYHTAGGNVSGAVEDGVSGAVEDGVSGAAEGSAAGAAGGSAAKGSTSGAAGKTAGSKKGFYNGDGRRKKPMGRNTDPDVIYGRGGNVEGDCVFISSLKEPSLGDVCVLGELLSIEERELRSGNFLLLCEITDDTDTIGFKVFAKPEDKDPLLEDLEVGKCYKLKGTVDYDSYARELAFASISGIKPVPDFRTKREDDSEDKRVELHLHTGFSESDSVVDVEKAIARAKQWGMKALAITDTAVVQAFPVANHALKKGDDFKVIYGVEGNFVDDLKPLVLNSQDRELFGDQEYVVFDIETTGLYRKKCKIIEIGAVRVNSAGKELGRFSEFINPEEPIPYDIVKLTSITDEMVIHAPTIEVILPKFLEFAKGAILVAHNATFDTGFIQEFCQRLGYPYPFPALDTMTMSYVLLPQLGRYNLDRLCKHFGVVNAHHHRACDDADVTAKIFVRLLEMLKEKGVTDTAALNRIGHESVDAAKKAYSHKGTILVKNETGRVNLYRLISESHLTYFNRVPKIPLSRIMKYREGLLLGTADATGQLYQALMEGDSDEEIARIVSFYDYLEVQPVSQNRHLIEDPDVVVIQSEEDLRDLNRRIIRLGKEFNKPVVATGDVHFLDPGDAAYLTVIQEGSSIKASSKDKTKQIPIAEGQTVLSNEMLRQPPRYFHTTTEMLKEFDYLDSDTAHEIVIENTQKIADMIEKISPVRPDKCPPVIPDSDKTLRDICETRAHEIYGPDLPEQVSSRLDRELNSIISNGYSVMYIIAQKLVWKSNADGYLVGSRGSVGSSFAATMAGITEVNPLSPHYICPECHFVDFDSEEVLSYSGMSGCDMPDRDCPKCGHKLIKEGHDIPFETFLGFKGDKEPDIDLNFSGDYQAKAHAYIGEIFGSDHAFRAGTITTYAEKTVFGYIKGFCERRGVTMRNAEMNRIVQHCLGVKRSTGQHPGGIIVMPDTEEIYSFTPIQKPANDMTSDQITTHFEYHSIDHNLLKFDILGHDDPTMIRRLEDLTGLDAKTIPLDDKKVMSLFHGTEALGITPKDIGGTRLGCLGIPEFGTDFAMQMVIDADPQNFSDLVRISGLSHGTDVWLGNAQDLIQSGICKLSSAICCRDDIMVYLMHMGVPSGDAFDIMEKVRKGIVAKGKCDKWDEWKQLMAEHDVPDWYMGSCEKIKYMFPKAHAVAYVMMGWRVAYFKVYHPLAYYAAFFSIRAKAFSYETMCQGRERLDRELEKIQKLEKFEKTAKDDDSIRDMRIVQEMYARGLEFMPIDVYRADDRYFQVIDGKIMPSFSSIDGMGDTAAAQLKEAAKDGIFLSQEELKNRAKISGSVVDKMAELGILGDMPKTGQLQFTFD